MTFFEAIRSGFRNYAGFTGRSRRSAFWWWVLFQVLALAAASILDSALRTPILYALTALALFLPGLALQVRRLHDTNRSGWWILLGLVPVVGIIILIVWWCAEGTRGANTYGADPVLSAGIDPSVFDSGAAVIDLPRRV